MFSPAEISSLYDDSQSDEHTSGEELTDQHVFFDDSSSSFLYLDSSSYVVCDPSMGKVTPLGFCSPPPPSQFHLAKSSHGGGRWLKNDFCNWMYVIFLQRPQSLSFAGRCLDPRRITRTSSTPCASCPAATRSWGWTATAHRVAPARGMGPRITELNVQDKMFGTSSPLFGTSSILIL